MTKEEKLAMYKEEERIRRERIKANHDMKRDDLSEELVHEFIDGAWRSVAIQLHFSGASRGVERLMHFDHVFSSLHMAVTLNGKRTVSFGINMAGNGESSNYNLPLQSGDVYCTTPAGILHGVSTNDLREDDRSVALQCRTLFGNRASKVWNQHSEELCKIVNTTLKEHPTKLPTFNEWKLVYQELLGEKTPEITSTLTTMTTTTTTTTTTKPETKYKFEYIPERSNE